MSEETKIEVASNIKPPYVTGMAPEALTSHDGGEAVPREGVHLYHFAISLCSQKVRMAMEYKEIEAKYHPVMINLHEQHLPQYVRINPRCVVPSLVIDGKVTTDSKNILEHLDNFFPDSSKQLVPSEESEKKLCQYWTQLADEMPMPSLTFGTIPGVKKPFPISMVATDTHFDELGEEVKTYIEKYKDDSHLKNAYEEKLKAYQHFSKIMQTPDHMKEAIDLVETSLAQLNEQLDKGPFSKGGYLCSQDLSTADIEWCVLLNRFIFVGAGSRWVYNKEKLPRVGPYFDKLCKLQCYKDGIKKFDSKLKLVSLVVTRKWNAAMGRETLV